MSSLQKITLLLALVASSFQLAVTSKSADLAIVHRANWGDAQPDRENPRCNLRLTGLIEVGDLERLKRSLEVVQSSWLSPRYLCINSRGGNYKEALSIADYLIKGDGVGVSTVIEADAECLSACALIFLGGSQRAYRAYYQGRWLHARGRLGFHSTFLKADDIPERTFTKKEVVGLVRAGQLNIRAALDLFSFPTYSRYPSGQKPWVKPNLFAEALLQDFDSLYSIDTIDRAGRWDVALFGTRDIFPITMEMVRQGCLNLRLWHLGWSAIGVAGGVLFTFKDEQSYTKTDEYDNYQVGFAAYPYPRCEVNVRGKEFFSLSLYDSGNAAEHVTSTNWRWSLLTPDTKLSDIAP